LPAVPHGKWMSISSLPFQKIPNTTAKAWTGVVQKR